MAKKKTIEVQGVKVKLYSESDKDYISLTDIAKQVDNRSEIVIQNWLRNAGTLDFLYEWESIYNQEFKHIEFDVFRKQAGKPGFVMTPKRWITSTDAIGITSKSGRGGGTYAHKDIAFEFCSAISAKFKLFLIQEFERLKSDEAAALDQPWNVNRYLSKINYYIHTDAVKTDVVPLLDQNTKRQNVFFAIEANRLNEIVFGMSAKQWQGMNPTKKGNMRDHASTVELQVLANIEVLNAELIKIGMAADERMALLKNAAERHTAIIEERERKQLKKGK